MIIYTITNYRGVAFLSKKECLIAIENLKENYPAQHFVICENQVADFDKVLKDINKSLGEH